MGCVTWHTNTSGRLNDEGGASRGRSTHAHVVRGQQGRAEACGGVAWSAPEGREWTVFWGAPEFIELARFWAPDIKRTF